MKSLPPESVLVLSQDYELFFKESGTVEKCLIEPSEQLLSFSGKHGVVVTFFVDAGMLRCFDKFSSSSLAVKRAASAVRDNLRRISGHGHELGLHVHPHWEDTRWVDGRWDFSSTRYQLRDFSAAETADILRSNFQLLQDLSAAPIQSYRAGGFCVEPFDRISPLLLELGVTVESSVVPGAKLVDPSKGFDFSASPDLPWWQFNDSPLVPEVAGKFTEIPITPGTTSRFYYWQRAIARLRAGPESAGASGVSKAIGKTEILRRLLGASRIAELSIDDAKASMLPASTTRDQSRQYWHVMGHPKLLSARSLDALQRFIRARNIRASTTVTALAKEFRAKAAGEVPGA